MPEEEHMDSDYENVRQGESETGDQAVPSGSAFLYSSARGRAIVVMALFGLGIVLSALMLASNLSEFQLLSRIINQELVTDNDIDANDIRQGVLGIAWTLWYLVTVVSFLMWVHRAHRNLPALGAAGLQFTPAWAVGWYFIPLANLFKPYQAMRELYNASDPTLSAEAGAVWLHQSGPFVVKLWWAWFLIMSFFGNIVARAGFQADTAVAMQLVAAGSAIDDVFSIIAAVAAAWLVWSVDRRQEERAKSLGLIPSPQFTIGDVEPQQL